MFGIHAHHLKSLPTFAAAESYWLRADDPASSPRNTLWQPNERPLKDRRSHHFRLARTMDAQQRTMYQAYLYNTPLVTYYQDGRITIRHWASQSSARFINYVSPFSSFIRDDTLYVSTMKGTYEPGDYGLTVHPDGEVTGYVPQYVERVDLKAAAKIRKALAPLIAAGEAYYKLTNSRYKHGYSMHDARFNLSRMIVGKLPEDLYVKTYAMFADRKALYRAAYETEGIVSKVQLEPGVIP